MRKQRWASRLEKALFVTHNVFNDIEVRFFFWFVLLRRLNQPGNNVKTTPWSMYCSRAALLKVVTPWSIYYSRAALLKVVTPGTNTFKPSASNQDTKSESTAVGLFGKIVPIVHQMYRIWIYIPPKNKAIDRKLNTKQLAVAFPVTNQCSPPGGLCRARRRPAAKANYHCVQTCSIEEEQMRMQITLHG